MKKYFRKATGLFMAFAFTFGSFGRVLAEETGVTESSLEMSTEIVSEEVTEEVMADEISVLVSDEPEVVTPIEEMNEETMAEESAPEIIENKEEQEEEPVSAEFAYTQMSGNALVELYAAAGVLPAGVSVTVTPMTLEEVKDLLDAYTNENGKEVIDASVYDIVFRDAAGNVVQPEGDVNVKITNPEQSNLTYEALRIQSAEEVEKLDFTDDTTEETVSFNSNHFTPVGVVAFAENEPENVPTPAAIEPTEVKSWMGYNEYVEGSTYVKPVYVRDNGQDYIAYCLNGYKDFPGAEGTVRTNYDKKYENASPEQLRSLTKKKYANAYENVMKTLYYGYPYNKGGIQERYGLNDMQFRCVTQAVIWAYTDDYLLDWSVNNLTTLYWYKPGTVQVEWKEVYKWTDEMTNAYDELKCNQDYTYPSDFQADIYEADKEGYTEADWQNLITTRIPKPNPTIDIPVEKKWDDNEDQDGIRPDSVTVRLYAGNQDTGKYVVLNEENSRKADFKDLPLYERGVEIAYTVAEDEVKGYTCETEGSKANGYILTNKHEIELVDINGTKIWNDRNNKEGKRPESITVVLLKNGEEIADTTASEQTNWEFRFTGLEKYEDGKEIIYTVDEVSVTGYTTRIDAFTIINSENTRTFVPMCG